MTFQLVSLGNLCKCVSLAQVHCLHNQELALSARYQCLPLLIAGLALEQADFDFELDTYFNFDRLDSAAYEAFEKLDIIDICLLKQI